MKTKKQMEDLIKRLLKDLDKYAGQDEWTAERGGWLYALHWVLDKKLPKDYIKSSIPDIGKK